MEYVIIVVNGDSYRRLGDSANKHAMSFNNTVPQHETVSMFGDMIMEIDVSYFENVIMDTFYHDEKIGNWVKLSSTGVVAIPDEIIQMSLEYGDNFDTAKYNGMITDYINSLLSKSRH